LPSESAQREEFTSRISSDAEGYSYFEQTANQNDGQVFCLEAAREGRADGDRSDTESNGNEKRNI